MGILAAVAALIAGILGFAATRPDDFRVQRSTRIRATPDRIFRSISDFHRWGEWSPWEHVDANLKRTYSGAASGTGAVYEWEGKKAGSGRMEITQVVPPNAVTIKLDFIKPFEAHHTTEFTLEPIGDTTEVKWLMYGPSPFVSKVMGVFVSMDRMIGKDFEKGLAALKEVAEQPEDAAR